MASGGQVMAIVVKLLDDAESALVTDRATAKACITRASALLQAEGGRQKQNSDGPSGTVTRGGLASWQIRRVTAYIEANLMAAIRLKDFTEITRLSTSHFARAFKASLGESVHGYIIRRRMERAQELMLTTNESLCQIALTCGLSDQAHFSRVFRRVVGVSPNVWRRQWLGHGSAGPAHAARALNG
jgi:AraC-like DNA-binding protein